MELKLDLNSLSDLSKLCDVDSDIKSDILIRLFDLYWNRRDYMGLCRMLTSEYKKYVNGRVYANHFDLLNWCAKSSHDALFRIIMCQERDGGPFDLHADDEEIFINVCCTYKIPFAKYLLSLQDTHGPINIHIDHEYALYSVFTQHMWERDYPKVSVFVNWMLSLEPQYGEYEWKAMDYRLLITALEKTRYHIPDDSKIVELLPECLKHVIKHDDITRDAYRMIRDIVSIQFSYNPSISKYIMDLMQTNLDANEQTVFFRKVINSWALMINVPFTRYCLNHPAISASINQRIHSRDNDLFKHASMDSQRILIQYVRKLYHYDWHHISSYRQYEEETMELAESLIILQKGIQEYNTNPLFDQNVALVIESFIVADLVPKFV
jgi:hypothetical protein